MDEEILQSLKDGRPDAMLLFYQNIKPLMCEYTLTFIQNQQDIEDIVSETIIEFIDKEKYREINSDLKAYMFVACKNRALNFLRTNRRELYRNTGYYENLHAQAQLYVRQYHESEEGARDEQVELIISAIEKLPKRKRVVMKMRYLEAKKLTVIAMETNQKPETVKRYLTLGVSNMRKMFGVRKAKRPPFQSLL